MSKGPSQQPDPVDRQLAQCPARLRSFRATRGWTLEELAERSGLSKPYLSRLEAGDRNPSIAAILTLARAYGVSVGELFEPAETTGSCIVVRGKEAAVHHGDGLRYATLSNSNRFNNLQPIRLTISATRAGDERYQHEGEEWVYVLKGAVRLLVGEERFNLFPGDAAHFQSDQPHRLTATDGRDAEVIVVACPLPETARIDPGRFHSRRAVR